MRQFTPNYVKMVISSEEFLMPDKEEILEGDYFYIYHLKSFGLLSGIDKEGYLELKMCKENYFRNFEFTGEKISIHPSTRKIKIMTLDELLNRIVGKYDLIPYSKVVNSFDPLAGVSFIEAMYATYIIIFYSRVWDLNHHRWLSTKDSIELLRDKLYNKH